MLKSHGVVRCIGLARQLHGAEDAFEFAVHRGASCRLSTLQRVGGGYAFGAAVQRGRCSGAACTHCTAVHSPLQGGAELITYAYSVNLGRGRPEREIQL